MVVKAVTDDSFENDVLGSESVVLVDFWATWCGPCRQIAPALAEIATEMGDTISVAKVDIDENMVTPQKYGVRGVPTLILFKNGEPIARKVGADAKGNIEKWITDSIVES